MLWSRAPVLDIAKSLLKKCGIWREKGWAVNVMEFMVKDLYIELHFSGVWD